MRFYWHTLYIFYIIFKQIWAWHHRWLSYLNVSFWVPVSPPCSPLSPPSCPLILKSLATPLHFEKILIWLTSMAWLWFNRSICLELPYGYQIGHKNPLSAPQRSAKSGKRLNWRRSLPLGWGENENALYSVSKKAFSHNLSLLCPPRV